MNRTETIKIMAVLRGAYPQFYRNISAQEAEDAVSLWHDMFREEAYPLVSAAVKSLIDGDEKGYPPHIGAVKAKLRLLTSKEEMSEIEAFALVAKAVRNSVYEAKEEFDRLPPILKRLVGSPAQLREWAMMDSDTFHSVVSSNLQRSYRAVAQRERELVKLPADVRAMLGKTAELLAIEEGTE